MPIAAKGPARDYTEALARASALRALDDDSIRPQARTLLLDHGAPGDLAVVLLHGYTNHPGQFRELAPLIHARGANVVVPRMPGHGDIDRMTTRLLRLTADALLARANEAVDIACGLGKRVAVLGISSGANLAVHLAVNRPDVAVGIPVAPAFGLLHFSVPTTRAIMALASRIPNLFLWWDPRARMKMYPMSAYPRFSTRGLAAIMSIAFEDYAAARTEAPTAGAMWFITNRADPAVNNRETHRFASELSVWRTMKVGYFEFRDLPVNHDIIEPDNPLARTERVYPVLLDQLFSPP